MPQPTSANQVSIHKILIATPQGKSVDITFLFTEMFIKESISMTSVNGSIVIEDDKDIYEFLPILGQELISVTFEMLDEFFTYVFRIYKVSEIERLSGRKSRYTLFFVSPEMLINEKNRISRAYANMKYSDMVENILQVDIGTSKDIAIETTQNVMTHIVPNLRPFAAINQILRKSVSNSGESNYIFFEDRRGFLAVPMSSFVSSPTKYTYTYRERSTEGIVGFQRPFDITAMQMPSLSNVLTLTNDGFFASQLHSIDLLQRKVDIYEYDYFSLFDEISHLNPEPLFLEEEEFNVEGKQYFTYSSETGRDSSYITSHDSNFKPDISSQYRARRRVQTLMFASYIVEIAITGNPLLYVGDVIEINYPARAIQGEQRQHNMMSGRGVVTSITHVFGNNGNYAQRVETVKDSLITPVGDTV